MPEVRVEIVRELPGSLRVLPLQVDELLVFRVVDGEMTEECAASWQRGLQYLADSGSLNPFP